VRRSILRPLGVFCLALSVSLSGCRSGTASGPSLPAIPAASLHESAGGHAGLGAVLNTKDGGQVFGFDINQTGNDGALASSRGTNKPGVFVVSVETFDQNTGAITASFANSTGTTNSFLFDGILAGDVGFVTHFEVPKGQVFAKHFYNLMNPVTANRFTGAWKAPVPNTNIMQTASNQSTTQNVLFTEDPATHNPELIVTDVAANTIQKVIPLDPNLFVGGNGPILSEDTVAKKAVIALSPDGGAVRHPGVPTETVQIDLATGTQTSFNGFADGFFGPGFVNGAAVDSGTHVQATTTELNSQVEFYNLSTQKGIKAAQLPCTRNVDQTTSGAGVANDPVNKLFLVSVPMNACAPGSAIDVYDETGKLVETITGFTFFLGEPPAVLNPSKRMGWALGPKPSQLQQFFY
jgi:hypothetical protein